MGRSQRLSVGTSIVVDRSFAPQITSNGILLEGRVQFITFQLLDNENLTIINIYDAHTSNERAQMWRRLSEASFDIAHVIVGGNFNHLEETNWRRKARERLMLKRAATTWHHMMLQYGVTKTWKLGQLLKNVQKGIHLLTRSQVPS